MRSLFAYFAGSLLSAGVSASTCCHRLDKTLGQKLSFPNDTSYEATVGSYWSMQESEIRPSCILHPTTAEDVSEAVSIISATEDCDFAIKGHGHSPAAGFANSPDGVTIDMTSIASVSLNDNDSVAMVGAGAKWLDVYQHLDGSGVQVSGGRNGNVGVGGLLVGGGISHFTTRVGWACDGVVNYEIVLSNGSLVNANKDHNSDLFLALKGGGNNFGVITRYDLATFPQGNISTTTISYDIAQRATVFQAFTDLLSSSRYDPLASLVTILLYSSTSKAWTLKCSAVYTEPVAEPVIFDKLSSIPHNSLSNSITSVATFANETETPPRNWLFATATFKPSAENMQNMFTALNNTLFSFNPEGGVTWSIAFEPLVAAMLPGVHAHKTNVLGLESAQDGFIVLISAFWANASAESDVEATAQSVLLRWESMARKKGLLQDFQYFNYAAPSQNPVQSYGLDNLEFLKHVSKKYDHAQILQKRVGGFKL